MDLELRKARADDGGADDDLGDISGNRRLEHRMYASDSVRDHLASSAADFVKNLFVGKLRLRCDNDPSIWAAAETVKAVTDTIVVESTPRHSSASNGLAQRTIWTLANNYTASWETKETLDTCTSLTTSP